MTDYREKLRAIKTFPSLVKFLRDDLDWPIAGADDFEELTYDYTPEELGIDSASAAKIEEIKRLRPLVANQPWGVFFVKFEPKQLPVVALRRILNGVVVKKRATASAAEQHKWATDDLLFISAYGEDEERRISFAHFSYDPTKNDLPTLKVLAWDDQDTPLHLDDVATRLVENLLWPSSEEEWDDETWRGRWSSAFELRHREVITTSKALAMRLAELARAIRVRIRGVIEIETQQGPVTCLMDAFREALIHDLEPDDFADMYAQTIAYGLLSARVANPRRDGSAGQLPVTNPFLKELMETFLHVGGTHEGQGSGIDFDELGVGDVVQLLDDANMDAVIRDFGDRNPQEDPVIHFYEGFAREYDPIDKVRRGEFYTPRPVVSYIVRSVHELLRTEFDLPDGLADTSTWGEMASRHKDISLPRGVAPDDSFIQILDPATGTGTFLVEVIDIIHRTLLAKWKASSRNDEEIAALWNDYVATHLLTRLHAYELKMAPYAIAHLKVGLKLSETGYRFGSDQRARIFLTNALEPAQDFSDRLDFAIPALAHEATAVNIVKGSQRFSVVLGNPPYAGHSLNKGHWITGKLRDYYKVNGNSLGERNTKWLQDDYVKFFRLAQECISSTGVGVLGYITNHGYIDNPTFRGMRQQLLRSFPDIRVLDLHGNSNKGEVSPDGSRDENVFDIQQGVAIFLGVKVADPDVVFFSHDDCYGVREEKYRRLLGPVSASLQQTAWYPEEPSFLFVQLDATMEAEYHLGWRVPDIFPRTLLGPNSHRDHFAVAFDHDAVQRRLDDLRNPLLTDSELRATYELRDNRDWSLSRARGSGDLPAARPVRCIYRPFDFRWMLYGSYAFDYPRPEVNDHLLRPNRALISTRQTKEAFAVLAANLPAGQHKLATPYDGSYLSPLYLYPDEQQLDGSKERVANVAPGFLSALGTRLDGRARERLRAREDEGVAEMFAYAYAVFFSPNYRERYGSFLKTDFPRVPLPRDAEVFEALAEIGNELLRHHLMEDETTDRGKVRAVGTGFRVEKVSYSERTVWIDSANTCGFDGVPEAVWQFHIGGYQVCEKWLKDRKGRTLSDDDLAHYQKIVVAISETIRLMKEIDEVIDAHGGWPDAFAAAVDGVHG